VDLIFSGLLIFVIIVLIIGIFRVISKPSNGFGSFLIELLCIDLLLDFIALILEIIVSILGD